MSPSDPLTKRRELILPFLNDKNPGVKKCASKALEKLESKADLDTWIRNLEKGAGNETRAKAIYALGMIPDERALQAIVPIAQDPDEDLRATLVRALRGREEKEVSNILTELLEDESPLVRSLAAETIGMRRDRSMVPYLLAHLGEKAQEVLEQVILALGKIGDPVAEKPLIEMLRQPEPRIRGLVLLALGDLEFS